MARSKVKEQEAIAFKLEAEIPKATTSLALYDATSNIIGMVDRAINNPKFDVKKMQAVLDMQERVMDRQSLMAFNISMNDAQMQIEPVAVNAYNSQTKSKYAKLKAVDMAIRPIYSAHGFSVSFNGSELTQDNKITIKALVAHREGHTREYILQGKLDITGFKGNANKTEIQGLGTTVSYLRRYLLLMIFNIIIDDEDTDGTGEKPPKQPDEFNQAVREEANKPVTQKPADNSEDQPWDGYVNYGKERIDCLKDAIKGAETLKEYMGRHKTKKSRIQLINGNLPLIKALVTAKLGAKVEEFHRFADEGA